MVECRWGECRVGMTKNAILARWHMQVRRLFTGCESIIVASFTAAGDLFVAGVKKV